MTVSRDIGLYVHIPFCRQRCHFCAFYLEIAREERTASFLAALEQEARLYHQHNLIGGRTLRTIYLGGGTPTAVPATQLIALLAQFRTAFSVDPNAEVTVEAHPSTVSRGDLERLAEAGVTRISFGAESMKEEDFVPIGRPGTVSDTATAVAAARDAGFANINLDVMYGLPGQTLDSWTATLHALVDLNPAHVSCYALTIEDGTRLAHDIERGHLPAPDESTQVEMDAAADSILAGAGFQRYEISNYARPGFACRHNLLYWTDGDYLGLGPSAQSYVDGVRFGNVADLTAYTEQLNQGILPVSERTVLSPSEQARDALVFGLRLLKGVPLHAVGGHRPPEGQRRAMDRLIAQGLLEMENSRVRLTPLGQRYADTVAEELF